MSTTTPRHFLPPQNQGCCHVHKFQCKNTFSRLKTQDLNSCMCPASFSVTLCTLQRGLRVNGSLSFLPYFSFQNSLFLADPYRVTSLNSLRSRLQIENTLHYCTICFTAERAPSPALSRAPTLIVCRWKVHKLVSLQRRSASPLFAESLRGETSVEIWCMRLT